MNNRIDHFTLGTSSLELGQSRLADAIGVTLPMGSKHAAMSTHNCVCQAGNDSFMELIAIDPEAPTPAEPGGSHLMIQPLLPASKMAPARFAGS